MLAPSSHPHWILALLVAAAMVSSVSGAAQEQAAAPDNDKTNRRAMTASALDCSWVAKRGWSSCSCANRCGTGTMTRPVVCVCGGIEARPALCSRSSPMDSSRACEDRSGCQYSCKYTAWGLCDKQCRSKSRLGSCMLGPFPEPNQRKCGGGCNECEAPCQPGDRKQGGSPCPPRCKWVADDQFGSCSATCGGGIKSRQAVCVADSCRTFSEAQTLQRGSNPCAGQCSQGSKPDTQLPCNTQRCPPPPLTCKWMAEENFGPCSCSCGGGTQTRQAVCVAASCRTFSDALTVQRGSNPCVDKCPPGTKPETQRACNTAACPAPLACKYVADPAFSACSVTCGSGVQTRNIYCIPASTTPEQQASLAARSRGYVNPCEGKCTGAAPARAQNCTTGVVCPPQQQVVCEESISRQVEDSPPLKNWVLYSRIVDAPPLPYGGFREGPANPPLSGSLELRTPSGTNKVYLYNFDHVGRLLNSVTAISYAIYRTAPPSPNPQQAVALNIALDFTGAGNFTTLVYEPVYNVPNYSDQAAPADNTWQVFDAYRGGAGIWWSSKSIPAAMSPSTYVPLATIMAANPAATIQAVGVNQGSGNLGLQSATDYLAFTSSLGAFVYNFQPCPAGGQQSP